MLQKEIYRDFCRTMATGIPSGGLKKVDAVFTKAPFLVFNPYNKRKRKIFKYGEGTSKAILICDNPVYCHISDISRKCCDFSLPPDVQKYCLHHTQIQKVVELFLRDWCTTLNSEPDTFIVNNNDLGDPWECFEIERIEKEESKQTSEVEIL